MTFALTAEQLQLMEDVRELGRFELAPLAASGEPGRVNRPLVRAMGEHKLLARLFPGLAEGSRGAVPALELCLLREALAQVSTHAETAFAMQGLGGTLILRFGTDGLVDEWVGAIARGEAVAAFALTEPAHGSDAAGLELAAERDGDGWRLSGVKTWISNAPDADVYVVFSRTTPDARAAGITAFVVPGDASGLSGHRVDLMADHPIGRLEFDGVAVADDHRLGPVDGGFRLAMETLDMFRPSVGAAAVGMAQAALHLAVVHARDRKAFGKKIKEFQAVSHTVAEMATRTQAARLLVYAAAAQYDAGAGEGQTRASAMAKLFATETAQWVVDRAMQIHGAVALERGHPLEHLYRDVRAPRIYEGTSEIQREIIARDLFRT